MDFDFSMLKNASELKGESDRAAAIVGTSILELRLEQLLSKVMIAHREVPEMFKGFAPLIT